MSLFARNRPRNLLCKVILLQFLQNELFQNIFFVKSFFVIILAAMVLLKIAGASFPVKHRLTLYSDCQERQRHINFRKTLGTTTGCLWDTWRDKQGLYGMENGQKGRNGEKVENPKHGKQPTVIFGPFWGGLPFVGVATPADPRGERSFFANFGRRKTFRKVPVKYFSAA